MTTKKISSWSYTLRAEDGTEDTVYQTANTIYINQSVSHKTGLQIYSVDGKAKYLMTQGTLDNLIEVLKARITVVDEINVRQMVVQPVIKEVKAKKK